VNVTMLLADSAQVADGKLYILGGGWSVTGPDPTPSAVAIKVMVDWHEFNSSHHWNCSSKTPMDSPCASTRPTDHSPLKYGRFLAVAPDGVPVGTPVDVPIAVNFGPIPLQDGSRFTWRLVIDGDSLPGGTVSFTRARRFPSPSKSESTRSAVRENGQMSSFERPSDATSRSSKSRRL